MKVEDVKKIMVIGAGTMGHSIAQVFAQKGIEVNLTARTEASLKNALAMIRENLTTLAEAGKLSGQQIDSVLNRVHITTDMEAAAEGVDFVLEAIPEQVDHKKKLYARLDEILPSNTIIASTTSGLNIFDIARITNPGRLIIHHWFTPAYIIPLVEVVPGPDTPQELIDFSVELITMLEKKPVVMKEFVPSFIVNRIQNVVIAEVFKMITNGWATPEQIDQAIKYSLGIRLPIVGLLQSLDFNGIDIIHDIFKKQGEANVPQLIKELVEKGHLGAKTGKGIYDYTGRSKDAVFRKRDKLYLEVMDKLEEIKAFDPV